MALAAVSNDLFSPRGLRPYDEASFGSPGSTAAAVAALVLSERHGMCLAGDAFGEQNDAAYQGDLSELIVGSLHWLADRQNADGGWGEPGLGSSVEATLFVRLAIQLTGAPACYADLESRCDGFLRGLTEAPAMLKQMGGDGDLTYPLIGACAAVGLSRWNQVPRAWLWRTIHAASNPNATQRPSVTAAALARWRMSARLAPVRKTIGRRVEPRLLALLAEQQSPAGAFVGSVAETSLVVMLLTSAGLRRTLIVQRGVDAILSALQPDGCWPDATATG